MAELTMVEALNQAMREEMQRDDSIVLLGEDVGVDGGVFRVTKGLIDDFGEERVIDTPLAESAIVGTAIGMAINGLRPIAEIQFSGFSYFAFHQIECHASRMRWRTGGGHTVPMVVRMPYGGGVRALEHHSESREAFYAHMPGLQTVIPSGPRNACALLKAAIRDPDPVIFMEPKAIYRAFREEVEEDIDPQPLGKAVLARKGDDITLISYGAMFSRTMKAADALAEDGVEADVIDLITLSPLDREAIAASVQKTGRAVIIVEAPRSYGPASEIAACIAEDALLFLKAPVGRVTGYDTPMPLFAREQLYLPSVDKILSAARNCLEF